MDGQTLGTMPSTIDRGAPDREATPAEMEFLDSEVKQRSALEDIRRRLEFGRADVAAMEKIERSILASLEVNEPSKISHA